LRRADGFAPNAGFRYLHYDQFKAGGGHLDGFCFMEQFRLGEHLQQVHRLVDECQRRGMTVIVVDMPVTIDLSEKLYPREFASYRQALAEVERQHGVRVIRGSREGAGLSDHDFADLIHLNPGGARKFSCWLRGQLEDASGVAFAPRGRSAP
jgi:hypothetical protein